MNLKRCLAWSWFLFCMAAALLLFVSGCAAGRGPNGEIITGIEVGRLPEQAGEFLGSAASLLPPPWNYAAGGVLALLGIGGPAAAARASAKASGAERVKSEADRAYEEGRAAEREAANTRDLHYDLGRAASTPPVPHPAVPPAGPVLASASNP